MRPRLRETLLVAVVLACSMPPTISASGSPTQLLASILAAARAERSVHYATAGRYGVVRVSFVGDAGVTRGIQRITYRKDTRTGHVRVIVSANTAYVYGDAFTLVNYMGFTAAQASKYGRVWILIPRADSSYSTVAAGVNLSSTINELKLSGQLSIVPDTKIGGQRVFGVRAKKTSSSGHRTVDTLYARAAGAPLPVKEIASQGTMRLTATFGRWNEPIHVATPTAPVPISVVRKTH